MFSGLSLPILLLIFVAGAIVVWVAGIQLSNTTDTMSSRFHLGEALGGLIFLAIATNLPEIAITVSAALSHNLGIAIGNILGGIAIQTIVLAILDGFGLRGKDPLTYRVASLSLVLEGVLVVAVLVIAIMGTQLPSSVIFVHVTPGSLLILVFWLAGLWLISKARKGLPWQDSGHAPDAASPGKDSDKKQKSIASTILIFSIASLATLIAGAALEESGNAIAGHIGLSGVLFGATILAAATALPELATGFGSVKIGDFELAVSDIFGGNAFLPVLFIFADVLSGQSVLAQAEKSDIYLACLGILLTTVYIYGLIFRPRRQFLYMGIDSFVVIMLYVLGIVGLIAVVHGK
ncbi:MAG: sodium:calcium antiporter [Ktedonobacteraceae bacterium]